MNEDEKPIILFNFTGRCKKWFCRKPVATVCWRGNKGPYRLCTKHAGELIPEITNYGAWDSTFPDIP